MKEKSNWQEAWQTRFLRGASLTDYSLCGTKVVTLKKKSISDNN